MEKDQFKHRKDIVEYLKEVATEVQGSVSPYNEKAGHFRKGMVHLRNADIFVAKGDFENAAKESKKSVKYLSVCIEAIRAAADSHFSTGKYEQAIQFYSDLIQEYPDTKDIHYQIGRCYSELRDYPKAIGKFEKEMTISGDDPDIHLQLGFASHMLGQGIYEEGLKKKMPMSNDVRMDCVARLNKAKEHYKKALGAVDQETLNSWINEINQILKVL